MKTATVEEPNILREITYHDIREDKLSFSDQLFNSLALHGRLVYLLNNKTGVAWELVLDDKSGAPDFLIKLCADNVFGFAANNIQAVSDMGNCLPKGVVANGYIIPSDFYGAKLVALKELRYGIYIHNPNAEVEDLKYLEQSKSIKNVFKEAKYNLADTKANKQACIIF